MAQMVKKQSYTTEKDVLIKDFFSCGVQVANTGVVAGSDGRKIIPAGTPVGGTTNVLLNRTATVAVTNTSGDGANAQGVLRHDVDVTDGTANGTLIVAGVVDLTKCPTIVDEAKGALAHIIFMKGE